MRNFLNFKSRTPPPETESGEIRRRETAICRMINLRREVDRRLRRKRSAENWPLHEVMETTEALIANIVEFSEVLQYDGYTEAESIQKLLFSLDLPRGVCTDLSSYLQFRLKTADPVYLAL